MTVYECCGRDCGARLECEDPNLTGTGWYVLYSVVRDPKRRDVRTSLVMCSRCVARGKRKRGRK